MAEKSNEKSLLAATLEWQERLRRSMVRSEVIWNEAVRECIELVGPVHVPRHDNSQCSRCWVQDRIRAALKLEAAGYITKRERAASKMADLCSASPFLGNEHKAYLQGVEDARKIMDSVVEDWE
jgi:hypothetical protein